MIDLNKKYRTKNGREVRIYAIDGNETGYVHGAIKGENGWFITSWRSDGISGFPDYDLVEVKPDEAKLEDRVVEIEFLQWWHYRLGLITLDSEKPLVLKAKIKGERL